MNNMEQFEVFCRYILWKGVVNRKINLKDNIVDKNKFAEPPALNLAGGYFFQNVKRAAYSGRDKNRETVDENEI